ncbi:MAG: hypothetical protein BHW00_04845 [Clostridium sp. 26_22]|nr:MAG: hypothetical protein BHW00_04845 [Clostridium sp. 26_22]
MNSTMITAKISNGCLSLLKSVENEESDEKFISKAICLAYELNIFLSFYRLNNDIIITLKSYDYAALENIAEKITNFQD